MSNQWNNRVKATDSELRLLTGEFVMADGTNGVLSSTGVNCNVLRTGVGSIRINLTGTYAHMQSCNLTLGASGSTVPRRLNYLSSSVTQSSLANIVSPTNHVAIRVVSGSVIQDPTQYITGSFMIWCKNTSLR